MTNDYYDKHGNKASLVKIAKRYNREVAFFKLKGDGIYQLTWRKFITRYPRMKGLADIKDKQFVSVSQKV